MNTTQAHKYIMTYLEATGCQVIETHPSYVTVKLSSDADRDLTNRPYYWSFVDRTGAEPETMTLTLVFDQEQVIPAHAGKSNFEPATFGSRKLQQIFDSVKQRGKYTHMYEVPSTERYGPSTPLCFTSYLGVNYKVEFICDMKREEIHSLGISLSTGDIISGFHEHVQSRPLTPRLPANIHIKETLSVARALASLEQYVETKIRVQDHSWAADAEQRLYDELHRVHAYYHELLRSTTDEAERNALSAQHLARQNEIAWQFKPRILVSAINCGIFHLAKPVSS